MRKIRLLAIAIVLALGTVSLAACDSEDAPTLCLLLPSAC